MANAKQLPSGAWRTRPSKYIDGKKITKSFTVHPDECGGDWKKAKKLSENRASNWLLEAEAEEVNMTAKTAIESYIKDRSAVLSPSTIADYKRMSKHFGDLVHVAADDVDSKMIQAKINEMAVDGLNARTIKNRVFFLIAALNFVGIEKKFKLRFPKQIKPNLSPPEPSEFHRLLALASPEEKLTIILAGLYTLRRGEIAGLCGEDLLWDLNSIYVHTSRVQNDKKEWVRRPMPKNLNSVRMIQLDPKIMEMLPKVGPDEYVISMNPNEITKHFMRLREKACVSCRFHDLRKYAASIRSAIMPGRYVEADGGWRKDSQILSTIYDKPFRESRKEYSKKFNEMVVEEYKKELFS